MEEIWVQALRHEKTDRALVPFAGVPPKAERAYREEIEGSGQVWNPAEVNKLYMPDGMRWCSICRRGGSGDLLWSGQSLQIPPLSAEKSIPCRCKIPTRNGRIHDWTHAPALYGEIGHKTALYGLVWSSPLASHLRGTNIFMDMIKDPPMSKFGRLREICIQMSDLYIETGMDVIAVVDPLVMISPKHLIYVRGFTAAFFIGAGAPCLASSSAAMLPSRSK